MPRLAHRIETLERRAQRPPVWSAGLCDSERIGLLNEAGCFRWEQGAVIFAPDLDELGELAIVIRRYVTTYAETHGYRVQTHGDPTPAN